ncbi:SDR family oxidoreductase [Sciscionella marina]|uniref:SDR family oxidoreductase n=1 Tax=Sciscionella marina TaxID=508770 RepID=UPI000374DA82|nr:SDR family oxidoreductase [Sciscionella marina]
MRDIDVFLTGGTGFIGRWLLSELTADGQRVAVLLRGGGNRIGELCSWIEAHGGRGDLIHGLAGDLAAPGLGLDAGDRALARTTRRVFHLGAAMSFGLAPEIAAQVNVKGSERITELAASAPHLRRLVLLSGFQHRRSGWLTANRYHDSKLDADTLVRQLAHARGVPLTTVHPGPVVGDSRTGETTQFWGWPTLVRALHRGRLPIVPGGPGHWFPLLAVDYLARFLAGAPQLDETLDGQYWLLHDATPPLHELLTAVADELGVRAPRLRVPVPLAALGLRAGLDRWTGLPAEALTFVSDDRFPTAEAHHVATALDLTEPDPIHLARTTARFLTVNGFQAAAPQRQP